MQKYSMKLISLKLYTIVHFVDDQQTLRVNPRRTHSLQVDGAYCLIVISVIIISVN